MNLSRREKYIFIVTAAIIISALAYNFIIETFFKKWSSINNEITIKKARLGKGLRLLENRNAIINEYNTYTASLKDISKILGYMEKQALSSGIKTSNIKPRPVVQEGLYKEYVIELQIEGAFSAINSFASRLLKPPLFITIKRFDLRTAAGASSNLRGTLILSKLLI